MLKAISLFEIRYQFRQPLFWCAFFLLGLMTFGAITSDGVQIGGGIGSVFRNAPIVILTLMGFMSLLGGLFFGTAFVATSVHRDFEYNIHHLFFSKPIRKFDYLVGRFSGALLISILVFLGPLLGILLGSFMPWLEPERLGPFQLGPYLFAFLVFVVPNMIFIGAVFFSLAALSRSMLFTYLGVVAFFVFYIIAANMLGDIENQTVASLLDPFGFSSLQLATRYWTVIERNNALPELAGAGQLLVNRLIWMGVGLAVFAACYIAFDPARQGRARRRRRKADEEADLVPAAARPLALPRVSQDFSLATQIRQFLQQARIEVVGVLKSVPFIVILAFGVVNVTGGARFTNSMFGTSVFPVTHLMLQAVQQSFLFLLVIIVIFYSGELIWKERSIKLNEVYDALPTPTWVTLASKLMALLAVVLASLTVSALALMAYQTYRGYTNYEVGLYAKGLLLAAIPFLLITVLSAFLQVLSNSKFLGYLLMILFLISDSVLDALDFDHNLYRYATAPDRTYSDMNGFGHFLLPYFWFMLYWACFAAVLFGLSILFRVRGTESTWKRRLQQAGQRFRGPVRGLIVAGLLGFITVGAYIFYNTNVLNRYVPGDRQEEMQAEYEKKYRKYVDMPMPRITAVRTEVDIFPEERRMEARGVYRMRNKTGRPIQELHVNIDPDVEVRKLAFRENKLVEKDEALGYSIYRFAKPLAPGEEMTLEFEVAADNPGFVNGGSDTGLVYNGTFFNNRQYFPNLGYNDGRELQDRNDRRKHGLPPVHRMAKVNDMFARRNTYLTKDSDWIDFETVVSTTPSQIALAPGYLQREWTQNGRRYFHYKMDSPILHFYSYLSADYKVKRDRWKDVAIEIYYHEPHTYNVDRMVEAIKGSLDYFTANFSPYQHRQARILEFPRYATFAQAFPNTMPFSESIGFIANLRDEEAIDYPFYVSAHEVAHQWWAHQVIGGDVQGCTMLSETLAQYSALMVMEKEYGKEKMRRFLKYELDNYLRNRGSELVEEVPLMYVENQPYIHYRKGSVILYALKDAIGEEKLNQALARFVEETAFQQPPYTVTPDLMKHIRAVTPPELQYMLHDMFETITLFENRVKEATYTQRPDGKYDVDLTLEARKVRADGQGAETPIQINDWVDVGVFTEGKDGKETGEKVLYLKKHRITQPTTRLKLVVDQLPARAGIDPYNKLVDRDSDDNRKRIEQGAGAS
jgi:ABC-2 type transport system permease protein